MVLEKERGLEEGRILKGFLSICSGCKKLRDEEENWSQIYIATHSEADFSHGMSPNCSKAMYPHLLD